MAEELPKIFGGIPDEFSNPEPTTEAVPDDLHPALQANKSTL
jgi:hypothetical protein